MLKKAPIKEMYQVNMYCDKCGKRMERSDIVFASLPPQFTYRCECGHTETSTMSFPNQVAVFDEGKATVITEEELKNLR